LGGRYVVSLVVAHGLLIIWGYAVTAHTDVVTQTGTLLTSYPDVLMATVAGLADPFTGRPVTHLASATVTGPSLTRADAYATAAFVLGPAALDWIATRPGYAALLVDPAGRVSRTPDFSVAQADWLMFTNQSTPKRSVHMPNSSPHICFSSGIRTLPPSHSFSQ
jgi:hypothetical protein